MNTGMFTFEWRSPESKDNIVLTARETEIFVPSLITHGRKLVVSGLGAGDKYTYDEARQTLFIVTQDASSASGRMHKIVVSVNPPLRPHFEVNTFWGDFGETILSGLVVFVGLFAIIKYHFYM
jgi:hypothetical protein